MTLTEQQKADYIEAGGATCPYCGSEDIEVWSREDDIGEAWNKVICLSCRKGWTNLYKLTGVEGG